MSAIPSPKSTLVQPFALRRGAKGGAVFGALHVPVAARPGAPGRRPGAALRVLSGKTKVMAAARCGREAVRPETMKNKPGCGVL